MVTELETWYYEEFNSVFHFLYVGHISVIEVHCPLIAVRGDNRNESAACQIMGHSSKVVAETSMLLLVPIVLACQE